MAEQSLELKVKESYIYGYPIVGMYELLHSQVLNPLTKTTGFGEFIHAASVATPETDFVPAPNNDTTYSRAWLDLRNGPVVMETPDTEDRFFSVQVLDLYSDTVCNIGKRLNGTKPGKYVFTGPDFTGTLPEGMVEISCRTPLILGFLRVLIGSVEQLDIVRNVQAGFRFYPMKQNGQISGEDVTSGKGNEFTEMTGKAGDPASLPEYRNSSFTEFFDTLSHVLALIPLSGKDREQQWRIEEINKAGLAESELKPSCEAALKEIDEGGLLFGENVNHWRIARKGIGVYGDDYLQRAVVWYKGALANVPEESLYPSSFKDENGEQLDGTNSYTLYFEKGMLPPVSQFWSLTMYRFSDAMLVANPIDRYSIGDRTKGLTYGKDGSLTIYIQNGEPDGDKASNWLPAPAEPFYVTLRLYGPDGSAVNGKWSPPPIRKIGTV